MIGRTIAPGVGECARLWMGRTNESDSLIETRGRGRGLHHYHGLLSDDNNNSDEKEKTDEKKTERGHPSVVNNYGTNTRKNKLLIGWRALELLYEVF